MALLRLPTGRVPKDAETRAMPCDGLAAAFAVARGTHRCRASCHGRPKPRPWRSPVPQSEENSFLSVNYLTLLDRFLNDAV
jgi:hypothetical protein